MVIKSAALAVLLALASCLSHDTIRPMPGPSFRKIERFDKAKMDKLIPSNAEIEVLGGGFAWTEGVVWLPTEKCILFSDIPNNRVMKWKEGQGMSQYLKPSGYTSGPPRGGETGSNALTLDSQGRLILCQHGDRRVARMDAPVNAPAPRFVTLADRYDGKRLNSPNDLVYHSSGALYFTDPPYGLVKQDETDPEKQLDFQGVYRLSKTGELTLLIKDLTRPNGICFSPDEKRLYIAVSDPKRAVFMVYDVKPDGTVANGRVFFDSTKWVEQGQLGLPDGIKCDHEGNLWAAGPGGIYIFTPEGVLLGAIRTGVATANLNWGDDGSMLYICADMGMLRVKTSTKGKGF